MNKRGIIGLIVIVGVLAAVGFFWFVGSENRDVPDENVSEVEDLNFSGDGVGSYQTKLECVPASCCHASTCVWESEAASCEGTFCTEECRGGMMDCGAGHCEVVEGECEVVWDE